MSSVNNNQNIKIVFGYSRNEPIRVQRSRKQKQISPNALPIKYCGRPTKYGNPFMVAMCEKTGFFSVIVDNKRVKDINLAFRIENYFLSGQNLMLKSKKDAAKVAVDAFRYFFDDFICNEDLNELKDKNLSCWCSLDSDCHVDVLFKKLNEL